MRRGFAGEELKKIGEHVNAVTVTGKRFRGEAIGGKIRENFALPRRFAGAQKPQPGSSAGSLENEIPDPHDPAFPERGAQVC